MSTIKIPICLSGVTDDITQFRILENVWGNALLNYVQYKFIDVLLACYALL